MSKARAIDDFCEFVAIGQFDVGPRTKRCCFGQDATILQAGREAFEQDRWGKLEPALNALVHQKRSKFENIYRGSDDRVKNQGYLLLRALWHSLAAMCRPGPDFDYECAALAADDYDKAWTPEGQAESTAAPDPAVFEDYLTGSCEIISPQRVGFWVVCDLLNNWSKQGSAPDNVRRTAAGAVVRRSGGQGLQIARIKNGRGQAAPG